MFDARSNEEGLEVNEITTDHVTTALKAVTASVFPHRALETQKLWMNRKMFKPSDLSTRQTAAAINRLNNALPMFPNGSEGSKFTPTEVIGLLEWSLPSAWRAKFDLDGFIPSMHTKGKLVAACEAIERNQVTNEKSSKTTDTHTKKKAKFENSKTSEQSGEKKKNNKSASFFCTEHGKNPTHATADCFTLKNRAKKGSSEKDTKRSFSNKTFRKEINMLAKKTSKANVLDLYATAIKREQAKLVKKSSKRKAAESDSTSDSDRSVHNMEQIQSILKTVPSGSLVASEKDQFDISSDDIAEEKQYQKKVAWLHDHGELDEMEFHGNESIDVSVEDSCMSE